MERSYSVFSATQSATRLAAQDPILIVASRVDPASYNIAQNLINEHGFLPSSAGGTSTYSREGIRLVILEKPCIYVEPTDFTGAYSSIIFASKHVSATSTPALTAHTTGNLTGKAEFGGRPEEVSRVDPTVIRRALREMRKGASSAGMSIDVTMEATHHGPTSFPCPVCFVEVGSGSSEWTNPSLGKIAADAIMVAATGPIDRLPTAVGFGGTHYASKHTRINLHGGYQIGHVVPKHALIEGVSDKVVQETLRKTIGNCKTALVDWKGLGGVERRMLVDRLSSWEYEVVRC